MGTAHVHYHLRQLLVFLNAFVVNKPEVLIANAAAKFNGDLLASLQQLKQRAG